MQNGSYEITHRVLNTKYILKHRNGSFKLYDINRDTFLRTITESYLNEWYAVGNKINEENKLYDIIHFVNGKEQGTILMKASYAVCVHKINELKQNSHTIGLLKPILCT